MRGGFAAQNSLCRAVGLSLSIAYKVMAFPGIIMQVMQMHAACFIKIPMHGTPGIEEDMIARTKQIVFSLMDVQGNSLQVVYVALGILFGEQGCPGSVYTYCGWIRKPHILSRRPAGTRASPGNSRARNSP